MSSATLILTPYSVLEIYSSYCRSHYLSEDLVAAACLYRGSFMSGGICPFSDSYVVFLGLLCAV